MYELGSWSMPCKETADGIYKDETYRHRQVGFTWGSKPENIFSVEDSSKAQVNWLAKKTSFNS